MEQRNLIDTKPNVILLQRHQYTHQCKELNIVHHYTKNYNPHRKKSKSFLATKISSAQEKPWGIGSCPPDFVLGGGIRLGFALWAKCAKI